MSPQKSHDRSPVIRKSSLKLPQNLSENLKNYEQKYIKSSRRLSNTGTGRRKSSVSFSVPNEEAVDNIDVASASSTEDSILDEDFLRYLNETSISDEKDMKESTTGNSFGDTTNILDDSKPRKDSVTNRLDNKLQKQSSHGKLPIERRSSKGNLATDIALEANKPVKIRGSDPKLFSRSMSFEASDLQMVPEENTIENTGDKTISTTPENSSKSLLVKDTKGIFHSSLIDDKESNSSDSGEYLSKRISRRNSYIYKEECGLVSAHSSDETIKTVSELDNTSVSEDLPLTAHVPKKEIRVLSEDEDSLRGETDRINPNNPSHKTPKSSPTAHSVRDVQVHAHPVRKASSRKEDWMTYSSSSSDTTSESEESVPFMRHSSRPSTARKQKEHTDATKSEARKLDQTSKISRTRESKRASSKSSRRSRSASSTTPRRSHRNKHRRSSSSTTPRRKSYRNKHRRSSRKHNQRRRKLSHTESCSLESYSSEDRARRCSCHSLCRQCRRYRDTCVNCKVRMLLKK